MPVQDNPKTQSYRFRTLLFVLGGIWILLAVGIMAGQLVGTPSIEIIWKTESEFDTAGFNIYRSEDRNQGFERINNSLIHATADTTSGADYIFIDTDVHKGITYYYLLEDVEFDNTTTVHEIVTGSTSSVEQWAVILAGISLIIGVAFIVLAVRR